MKLAQWILEIGPVVTFCVGCSATDDVSPPADVSAGTTGVTTGGTKNNGGQSSVGGAKNAGGTKASATSGGGGATGIGGAKATGGRTR